MIKRERESLTIAEILHFPLKPAFSFLSSDPCCWVSESGKTQYQQNQRDCVYICMRYFTPQLTDQMNSLLHTHTHLMQVIPCILFSIM